MTLSVIIPVYNEERTIEKVIRQLLNVSEVSQIIVVNDGSTDGTQKALSKIKEKKVQVFHKENEGKGSAIIFGLNKVTGDFVLVQDADLEYHPEDITFLTDAVRKRNVQVVYGSRFLGAHSNLLYWHKVGNQFLNFLVNILYNTTLSDMETCYKLIPTELLREIQLKSNGFEIETEITCKILKKNIRIYEVPISYVGRDFLEGKKITWMDGMKAIFYIIKYRVTE